MLGFSIEITVSAEGVRSVRVCGRDWEQSAQAYALLARLGRVIQELDSAAKETASLPFANDEVM